jgi:hypothetical protein
VRAIIHVNNAAHQREHAAWVRSGLERHGAKVSFAPWNAVGWERRQPPDLVVIWGWKQRHVITACQQRGIPIVVMERAHLQPRMEWTSCGLNGLGNRGTYAACNDGGARWRQHFDHLMQPWRNPSDPPRDCALICGQVAGDASLWGCDFHAWAQSATDKLRAAGMEVVYRPHPLSVRLQRDLWRPAHARFSTAPLADDLAGAALVVTYNSTVGVETVLAGVPTVTFDQGAMAWDVTTHDLDAVPVRPDRTEWAHRLAWTGFLPKEIEDGTMWEHLKEAMPCATADSTAA